MLKLRAYLPFLLCLLLGACAATPPATDATQRSWQQHRDRVLASDRWTLRGRLNIRDDNSSDTVNIRWRQDGDDFRINLTGTLGLGAVAITGSSDGVLIEQSGEEPVTAANLAELSIRYLGYEFPAHALYYWVRGVPAPAGDANVSLNDRELLAALSQRDTLGNMWRLEYDRYRPSSNILLPGRIIMRHPDYRLTFLIDDWRIGTEAVT